MFKKIFILMTAAFFMACSGDSGNVDEYDRVGSNGLPTSLNIFPNIGNIKDPAGNTPQTVRITMEVNFKNVDMSQFIAQLVRGGFTYNHVDIGDEYIKGDAYCRINKYFDTYMSMILWVDAPISDNYIKEFYSYFPLIPGYDKRLTFEYTDLDTNSIDAYISMLKDIGFQKIIQNEYWYEQYCFVFGGSKKYGYYIIVSNSGSGLVYADKH